jgi:hypothetical protein
MMPFSFHPFGYVKVPFGILYLQLLAIMSAGLLQFSRPLLQCLIRESNSSRHFLQIQLQQSSLVQGEPIFLFVGEHGTPRLVEALQEVHKYTVTMRFSQFNIEHRPEIMLVVKNDIKEGAVDLQTAVVVDET